MFSWSDITVSMDQNNEVPIYSLGLLASTPDMRIQLQHGIVIGDMGSEIGYSREHSAELVTPAAQGLIEWHLWPW